MAYPADVLSLSAGVAIVLLVSYGAAGGFAKTHSHLFNPAHEEDDHGGQPWTVRSVIMLAIAGAAVGLMSEILVGSITEASEAIGLSPFFVGVIVVAIVGNAAEHWVAVYSLCATRPTRQHRGQSGAQIALFVAPVLVLASFAIGPFPMALVFNGFEIGAVLLAVFIAQEVTQRGDSTCSKGCTSPSTRCSP